MNYTSIYYMYLRLIFAIFRFDMILLQFTASEGVPEVHSEESDDGRIS